MAVRSGDDRQVCHRLLQRLALARRAIIGIYFPPIPWPMTVFHFSSGPLRPSHHFLSHPPNMPTNKGGAAKPDHGHLAWDHRKPWHHALWAPQTYPWRGRAKPLGGRAAAAHVGCYVFCVLCFFFVLWSRARLIATNDTSLTPIMHRVLF